MAGWVEGRRGGVGLEPRPLGSDVNLAVDELQESGFISGTKDDLAETLYVRVD